MVILSGPEPIEGGNFGDDRLVVDLFGSNFADHLGGNFVLLTRVIEDRRSVRAADVIALTI